MKKLFTFLLLMAAFNFMKAQTLHKQYPINYCGTGYCHQSTLLHGGRYYIAYVEDTTMMPSNKLCLTVLKNDANGNLIWKRHYRINGTYTATAAPKKILAGGANLYIGGNLFESAGNYPFITSIDTTNGNVNYFNKYTSSFTSSDIMINDLTVLNNGDIMAVGRIISGLNRFFYALRVVGTTGTIVNNGMSTFYTDQEAFSVCQFSNSSIFVVGRRGSYPFIAKLNNNSGLSPVGSYTINAGAMPVSSSFNQIIKAGNNLVVMGSSSGTGQNDFIARIDSNVNMSSTPPYILNRFTMNSYLPTYLYQRGSLTLVAGLSGSGNSLAFFNSALNFVSGYSYGSTGSMNHSLQYYNSKTYLTTGTYFTAGNLYLYKGDSTGLTSCAMMINPTYSVLTVTTAMAQIGVFTSGSITPVNPSPVVVPTNPITTCLSTGLNSLSENLAEVKLLTLNEAYVFSSVMETINAVQIYDINGKLISDEANLKTNEYRFETSSLPSGIYLARVGHGNQQKVFKLIKN
ncbi:MAG: T9SS type A sorting domain-containing protein [Bacteroidetes bacterium]|nr:T9SS type A sorting domain-containing protein [Bacteroidota bacterium]